MKILFITSSSINGGAQKHIREMFRSLTRMGNDVYLIAPDGWLVDELKEYEQKTKVLKASVFHIPALRRMIHQINPEIVNTFILSGGCFGVAGWKKEKLGKIFVTVNNPVLYEGASLLRRFLYPRLYRWMSRYVSAFLVKSDMVQKEVSAVICHSCPVLSIKNGIDFSVFDRNCSYPDLRGELGILRDEVVVVNVAALNKIKGQEYLIYAVVKLRKRYPVKLLIVGEGSYREILEREIKLCGAEQFVYLLGRRTDINAVLYNSDIFVLSSIYEGLPNSLMEAMAMGLSCVASDVGGVRQLIVNSNMGRIVQSKDIDGLVSELEKLVINKTLRMSCGEEALNFVKRKYSQEKVAEELLGIYETYGKSSSVIRIV